MRHYTIIIALFTLLAAIPAQAQNMKWGKVPSEDLSMTSYADDPDADAVVLGQEGMVDFREGTMYYKKHSRIKLLKKSSFDEWGKAELYYSPSVDKLIDFDAQVISPNGETTKIKKGDMFNEKVDKDKNAHKVAFPNLTEGSIVEYRFTLTSDSPHVPGWAFQSSIPVRHSSYTVEMPTPFEYIIFSKGKKPDVSKKEETTKVYAVDRFGRDVTYTLYQYEMNKVPALKEEAYTTTLRNYLASVIFQLKGYSLPGIAYKEILTTWPKFAKSVRESETIGEVYTKKKHFKKAWEALQPLLANAKTDMDKLVATKKFVAEAMQWNGNFTHYSDDTAAAFAEKKGGSGDFNLLLIALLNEAGVKAIPILVSTRDHGKPVSSYPIWSQFNHLVAMVQTDKGDMLVDAFEQQLPAGLPYTNSLNEEGFAIWPDKEAWIAIKSERSTKSSLVKMTLDSDGNLKGNVQTQYDNYLAYNKRKQLSNTKDEADYLQKRIVEALPNAKALNYNSENKDNPYEKLRESFDLEVESYAEQAGELLYFNPMLNEAYKDNPFKLEKREYPVEMPYPIKENYLFTLQLPDGYAVESLPSDSKVELPEGAASFTYTFTNKGNQVQASMRMSIDKTVFMPEEYPYLKQFYDLIVAKQAEQIVLKKL
jgi:hypothetical protein